MLGAKTIRAPPTGSSFSSQMGDRDFTQYMINASCFPLFIAVSDFTLDIYFVTIWLLLDQVPLLLECINTSNVLMDTSAAGRYYEKEITL